MRSLYDCDWLRWWGRIAWFWRRLTNIVVCITFSIRILLLWSIWGTIKRNLLIIIHNLLMSSLECTLIHSATCSTVTIYKWVFNSFSLLTAFSPWMLVHSLINVRLIFLLWTLIKFLSKVCNRLALYSRIWFDIFNSDLVFRSLWMIGHVKFLVKCVIC